MIHDVTLDVQVTGKSLYHADISMEVKTLQMPGMTATVKAPALPGGRLERANRIESELQARISAAQKNKSYGS